MPSPVAAGELVDCRPCVWRAKRETIASFALKPPVAMTTAGASILYSLPFVLRTTTPLTRPSASVVILLTAVRVRMGTPWDSIPCRRALMISGPMRPRLGWMPRLETVPSSLRLQAV